MDCRTEYLPSEQANQHEQEQVPGERAERLTGSGPAGGDAEDSPKEHKNPEQEGELHASQSHVAPLLALREPHEALQCRAEALPAGRADAAVQGEDAVAHGLGVAVGPLLAGGFGSAKRMSGR